jgi:hypothetical protein
MIPGNSGTNPDGQPFSLGFNAHRRMERDISELLGLAKGLLADGVICREEADHLKSWVAVHPDASDVWPCNIIAARLDRIYRNGVVTDEERDDLRDLLSDLVGGKAGILVGLDAATALPINRPPPKVVFRGRTFVLTGKFAMGPRASCERLTTKAGGTCESDVTQRTRYLVVGTFGSRDWVHTSHGRKIEKAVEYRDSGQAIAIIQEDHWAHAIPKTV